MAVPKYDELTWPLLETLRDGTQRTTREIAVAHPPKAFVKTCSAISRTESQTRCAMDYKAQPLVRSSKVSTAWLFEE